ncbi:hypothetical protein Dsin_018843 [Dipteronia sinensis]|uniref:Uncharacterized protein n=1 Tax=Dipteronia sinensis TaxID=43782 RepID=A0AAE0A627_9ROSI|nr:hypothetical protein Dsin_018843 [Dipteronia sinensis]
MGRASVGRPDRPASETGQAQARFAGGLGRSLIWKISGWARGTVKNLRNIMYTFEVYGSIFGQLVNWGKSSIYFGTSVSLSRIGKLQSLVGMLMGQLPISYLGVSLF